jgi:hypothetical protein
VPHPSGDRQRDSKGGGNEIVREIVPYQRRGADRQCSIGSTEWVASEKNPSDGLSLGGPPDLSLPALVIQQLPSAYQRGVGDYRILQREKGGIANTLMGFLDVAALPSLCGNGQKTKLSTNNRTEDFDGKCDELGW